MCYERAVMENIEEVAMGDTKGRWQKYKEGDGHTDNKLRQASHVRMRKCVHRHIQKWSFPLKDTVTH